MPSGFVERRLVDGIRAASEGLFPENDLGAPDWRDTEMVRRTREYIDDLPPQRRLLVFLFVFVELVALSPLSPRHFQARPSAARRRHAAGGDLAAAAPARRRAQASTTMIYMSHPLVIAYIEEYRICEHPSDPVQYPTRPGALAEMTVTK
jgi:hypothetical protein